jgi:hypothetical protein
MASKTQAEWLDEMTAGRIVDCNAGSVTLEEDAQLGDDDTITARVAEAAEPLTMGLDALIEVRDKN